MISKQWITLVNPYFSIMNKRGWKKGWLVWWFDGQIRWCRGKWFYKYFFIKLLGQLHDTNNIGLYRGDGLSVFKSCSGLQMEKIKKYLQKVFKNNDLDVIIECNMKIVNYLDMDFNFNNVISRPYKKQTNLATLKISVWFNPPFSKNVFTKISIKIGKHF